MKKILSLVMMIIILIVGTQVPIAASSDEPSSWAKAEVDSAIQNGYVPAHLQSNYQDPITREEFAELFVTAVFAAFNKILAKAGMTEELAWGTKTLTLDLFLEKISTTEQFTDTDNKYVKVANILGMVNGIGDNKFNPDGLITREQAAIMFVNYLQTVSPNNTNVAPKHLDDLDESSSWAREAVARAYGADYIKGTKAVKTDGWGNILEKGHFDTKGNLTREQAIIVISRLGDGRNDLRYLVLRGYLQISMDALMCGFDIEGNTIKMKSIGLDYKYAELKNYWRTQKYLKKYVEDNTLESLIAILLLPNLTQCEMTEPENIEKVLSGEKTFYDYKLFTVEHNVDSYLTVITKIDGFGYMSGGGSKLLYGDNNQFAVTIQK